MKYTRRRGFTIIEIMVATVIMSGLFLTLHKMWSKQQQDIERNTKREHLQKQTRIVMGYLQKDMKAISDKSFKTAGDEHYMFQVFAEGDDQNQAKFNLVDVSYWRDETERTVWRKYNGTAQLIGRDIEHLKIIATGQSSDGGDATYGMFDRKGVQYAGMALSVDILGTAELTGVLKAGDDDVLAQEVVEIRETQTVYLRDLHYKFASQHWKSNEDYKKGLINTEGNFTLASDVEGMFDDIVDNAGNYASQMSNLAGLKSKLFDLQGKEQELLDKKAEIEQELAQVEEDIDDCGLFEGDKKDGLKDQRDALKDALSNINNDSLPDIREAISELKDSITNFGSDGD